MEFSSIIRKLTGLYDSLSYKIFSKKINNFTKDIIDQLKNNSPVYTGRFKSNWHSDISGNRVTISNISDYAKYIEYGSIPGEYPWPSVGKRTMMYEGRIYSSQAPGGVLRKTLQSNNITRIIERHFRFEI